MIFYKLCVCTSNKFVLNKWKSRQENEIFNKLHEINSNLELSTSLSLFDDHVLLLRCRKGHTKSSHSYLLTNFKDDALLCIPCNEFSLLNCFLCSSQ